MSRVSTINLSAVLTNLKKNVLYRIQIQAVNGLNKSKWSEYTLAYTTNKIVTQGSVVKEVPVRAFRRKVDNNVNYAYVFCTDEVIFDRVTSLAQMTDAIQEWESVINFLSTEEKDRTDECSDTEKQPPYLSGSIDLIRMATLRYLVKVCSTGDIEKNKNILGCAIHYRTAPIQKTQVLIRRGLDTDSDCSKLSWVTLHELGHVFGLGDIEIYKPSVMSYDVSNGYKCTPTLNDITAIVALYQTK